MSARAENLTEAATWQLKHEVAYWKSKAMALEYENKILHRAIRQHCIGVGADVDETIPNKSDSAFQYECDSVDSTDSEYEQDENADPECGASDQDKFEVSEEYIQFLRDNQVYRESARQERQRINSKADAEKRHIEEMEAGPSEQTEDHQETLKNLYGDGWERISALEMSLETQFISICDSDKPVYWPHIPFNFNIG